MNSEANKEEKTNKEQKKRNVSKLKPSYIESDIKAEQIKKSRISAMKTKDGTATSNRGEVLNICAFYQEQYSSNLGQNEASFMSPNQNELPKITLLKRSSLQ